MFRVELERRAAKMIFAKAGGNASKGAISNKVTIPTSWVKAMGITQDNRNITLSFTGDEIIIKKSAEQPDV